MLNICKILVISIEATRKHFACFMVFNIFNILLIFINFLFWFLEIRFFYVGTFFVNQVGLELRDSPSSAPPSAEIKGIRHHYVAIFFLLKLFYVHCVYVCVRVRFLETGSNELLCGWWELNPGLLKERPGALNVWAHCPAPLLGFSCLHYSHHYYF